MRFILRPIFMGLLPLAIAPALAAGSAGECTAAWQPTFGGLTGVDGTVSALAAFDDGLGEGPVLFVGGKFPTAGHVPAANIARWNGSGWSALGAGVNGEVRALTVHDDGSGPALYAGGWFTQAGGGPAGFVARWDGTSWSPLGAGTAGVVLTLEVHDDGSGPALYAAGLFTHAGGAAASNIARWNGSAWQALGGGVDDVVYTLRSHDNGNGPALFAGGTFGSAGGLPAAGIARWDGSSWSGVGGGVNVHVWALGVFDEGSGPRLFAGGNFTQAGGAPAARLARWDGSAWSAVGGGVSDSVRSLVVHTDSQGTSLFVGGFFNSVGSGPGQVHSPRVARWDGSAWSHASPGSGFELISMLEWDDGSGAGPGLIVGGDFQSPGIPRRGLLSRRGGLWTQLGSGLYHDVNALGVVDLGQGNGPSLYAGGGGVLLEGASLARWDGDAWHAIPGGPATVRSLTAFDDGSGLSLFAGGTQAPGGTFGIARYDGSSWHPVGAGLDGEALALIPFDDGTGTALFVGGSFTKAGGAPAPYLARWDGAAWTAVGAGAFLNGPVLSLAVHDDGQGPALYVGGSFSSAGGLAVNGIARWDGSAWQALGTGMAVSLGTYQVGTLASYDDGLGDGPLLFAGGRFSSAGGVPASCFAQWDGAAWSKVGSVGMSDPPRAMAVHDDGAGPALFVAGEFHWVGSLNAMRIARWDGLGWSALGQGAGAIPLALAAHEVVPGTGPSLVVGGMFREFPGLLPDTFVARWGCPVGPLGTPFCFGDGSGTPCPCANFGGAGAGCANSTGQGSELTADGSASIAASDLALHASSLPPNRPGMFFQGTIRANGGAGFAFGDGLRCAGGFNRRLEVVFSNGSGDASSTSGIAGLGAVGAGDTRTYQYWYRDGGGSPCGTGFNLTNGLELSWLP